MVRLDSSQQHEAIYNASRSRGISVNAFCLSAILNAAIVSGNPPAQKPVNKEEFRQTLLDATAMDCDPFDLISLKQLEQIAKLSGVDETKVFQILQKFINECR